MKTEMWCVRHRFGWCALPKGTTPDPRALSDKTLCNHYVILRVGEEKRLPDCPDCLKILGGQA